MTLTYEEAARRFRYDPETGKLLYNVATLHRRAGEEVGTLDNYGYLIVNINHKHFKVARLAWLLWYGEWPQGIIDHVDKIKTNNKIDNLRCVTPKESLKNRGMYLTNRSGYPGVSEDKFRNKWVVRIGGKFRGRFSSLEEAAKIAAEIYQREDMGAFG